AAYQGALTDPVTITARLTQALPANGSREHWMRAKLTYADGGVTVAPYRDQDSSLVSVFAMSDALMRRLAGAPAAAAGRGGGVAGVLRPWRACGGPRTPRTPETAPPRGALPPISRPIGARSRAKALSGAPSIRSGASRSAIRRRAPSRPT